jgi:hypothetical protein
MYPSYPCFQRCSDLAVQFSVPERHVVRHILNCTEGEENLRSKAAANILIARVRSVGGLMSRHRIQVESLGDNEMGVTLFLPPPPCPEPKTDFSRASKRKAFSPTLAPIKEENHRELEAQSREWVTMFEYLPSDAERTLLRKVKAASLKLFL